MTFSRVLGSIVSAPGASGRIVARRSRILLGAMLVLVVGGVSSLAVSSAYGQTPGPVEWSSGTGWNPRCPGVVPGTIRYRLLCPGGYPVTTPWLLGPALGVLLLGTGMALRRRRATTAMASLPVLVFTPPAAAEPAGGESEAAPPVRPGSGLPPRLVEPVPAERAGGGPASSGGWTAASGVLADDATIQLLPGRLRLLSGTEKEREFRFARTPGRVPEVTIGRQSGEPPWHVQLAAPTVSRLHARMRFEGGGWKIENLSHTNPLVINGKVQGVDSVAQLLHEGDQLEIGEFVLIYHER